MEYSVYQFLWFFALYSLIGWVLGTSAAAVREKRFVDVGFLYGPYCPAYGFAGAAFAFFLTELKEEPFFLFLGGIVLSALITWTTGFILEKIFHRKWWDFSRKRFHFGGYVHLPYSVLWGLLTLVSVLFVNPLITRALHLLPDLLEKSLVIAFFVLMGIDFVGTVTGVIAVNSKIKKASIIYGVSENMQKTADQLGEGLTGWVLKHMSRAYPNLEAQKLLQARLEKERLAEEAKEKAGVFAIGCSFYKLTGLFFLGAFLGDITETIFCYLTTGRLMSRSSVVYGPFSIVWGFACALLTFVLYQYRNRSDGYIFCFGTVVGGAYEYICSVISEVLFGTVFWDYSKLPFNLGGRINLLYCFFWGIAAVVWLKLLYPLLSGMIEKIPKKIGIIATWVMILLMVIDLALSGLALARYSERQTLLREQQSIQAESGLELFLDEHFPDERMKRIYPNAIIVE